MAFGFPEHQFSTGGEDATDMIQVDFGDERVVLTLADHDSIVAQSGDADEYRALVEAAKRLAGDEWRRNRGPDSPKGRAQESGGPFPTDHGGESR